MKETKWELNKVDGKLNLTYYQKSRDKKNSLTIQADTLDKLSLEDLLALKKMLNEFVYDARFHSMTEHVPEKETLNLPNNLGDIINEAKFPVGSKWKMISSIYTARPSNTIYTILNHVKKGDKMMHYPGLENSSYPKDGVVFDHNCWDSFKEMLSGTSYERVVELTNEEKAPIGSKWKLKSKSGPVWTVGGHVKKGQTMDHYKEISHLTYWKDGVLFKEAHSWDTFDSLFNGYTRVPDDTLVT